MRTSKNSSRLDDTMHRKRSRSNSGTRESCAYANTRRLNANRLLSRQRMRLDWGMGNFRSINMVVMKIIA